jgi:hypothetical protein
MTIQREKIKKMQGSVWGVCIFGEIMLRTIQTMKTSRKKIKNDRVAWHLGGISDYEVGLKVEKSIAALKSITG